MNFQRSQQNLAYQICLNRLNLQSFCMYQGLFFSSNESYMSSGSQFDLAEMMNNLNPFGYGDSEASMMSITSNCTSMQCEQMGDNRMIDQKQYDFEVSVAFFRKARDQQTKKDSIKNIIEIIDKNKSLRSFYPCIEAEWGSIEYFLEEMMEFSLKYKLYDRVKIICRKMRKNLKLKKTLNEGNRCQMPLLRNILKFLKEIRGDQKRTQFGLGALAALSSENNSFKDELIECHSKDLINIFCFNPTPLKQKYIIQFLSKFELKDKFLFFITNLIGQLVHNQLSEQNAEKRLILSMMVMKILKLKEFDEFMLLKQIEGSSETHPRAKMVLQKLFFTLGIPTNRSR